MSLLEDSLGLVMSLLEDSSVMSLLEDSSVFIALIMQVVAGNANALVLLEDLEVDEVEVLIVTSSLCLLESTAGMPLVVVTRGLAPAPDGDNSSSLCCLRACILDTDSGLQWCR